MGLAADSPFSPLPLDRIVLETKNTVAFYDLHPLTEGHALVVPKTTVASFYDLDAPIQAEVWETVRRVRDVLAARLHPDGFNIGINDGAASGQTVAHAHVHVIPRYAGDAPDPRGGIRWILPAKARYWS